MKVYQKTKTYKCGIHKAHKICVDEYYRSIGNS